MRTLLLGQAVALTSELYRYERTTEYDACNEDGNNLRKYPSEQGDITGLQTMDDGVVCIMQTHGSMSIDCLEHPGFSLPGKPVAAIRKHDRGDTTCSGTVKPQQIMYWNHYDLKWFLDGGCIFFDLAFPPGYHKFSVPLGSAAMPACATEWLETPGISFETVHIHPRIPDQQTDNSIPIGEELCAPDLRTPQMTNHLLYGGVVEQLHQCRGVLTFGRLPYHLLWFRTPRVGEMREVASLCMCL
jgi:hypothetical protein